MPSINYRSRIPVLGRLISAILLSCLIASIAKAESSSNETPAIAYRTATAEFSKTLQTELTNAISAGGPVHAIDVCNKKAAAIATDLSNKHHWTMRRTSLKVRNPKNVPDEWEQRVLESFSARKANGEDPSTLEFLEVIRNGDNVENRYMKAIVIAPNGPCLMCHGNDIPASVSTKIQSLYPTDQAAGYKAGDIRGAFSIRQTIR